MAGVVGVIVAETEEEMAVAVVRVIEEHQDNQEKKYKDVKNKLIILVINEESNDKS